MSEDYCRLLLQMVVFFGPITALRSDGHIYTSKELILPRHDKHKFKLLPREPENLICGNDLNSYSYRQYKMVQSVNPKLKMVHSGPCLMNLRTTPDEAGAPSDPVDPAAPSSPNTHPGGANQPSNPPYQGGSLPPNCLSHPGDPNCPQYPGDPSYPGGPMYPGGHYPSEPMYPGGNYPGEPMYPGGNYPGGPMYPGGNYPGGPMYPGGHYPGGPMYPGGNYPGGPMYPSGHYPGGPMYPGGHYPGGPMYPGGNYPGGPMYPGGNYPGGPMYPGGHYPGGPMYPNGPTNQYPWSYYPKGPYHGGHHHGYYPVGPYPASAPGSSNVQVCVLFLSCNKIKKRLKSLKGKNGGKTPPLVIGLKRLLKNSSKKIE
ncbi:basic salivary proline-rich protein 1-like [Plodia interpunctella]|uniref:basic salivary proline-rich protein 1-like n=1 Tax=Plodia interpunctella TaxID=58824 RepID=UPI003100E98C